MNAISKICLVITIVFCFQLNAQKINGVYLKDLDIKYIEIELTMRFFKNGYHVLVDYGQQTNYLNTFKQRVLTNDDGDPIEFNSSIAVLNYFYNLEYELVNAFPKKNEVEENSFNYFYILKKVSKD